jgi:hypothetical protein
MLNRREGHVRVHETSDQHKHQTKKHKYTYIIFSYLRLTSVRQTFTMLGEPISSPSFDLDLLGVIPRSVNYMFERISNMTGPSLPYKSVGVEIALVEIYMEKWCVFSFSVCLMI